MSNITDIRLSGTTYQLIDSTAVHSLDGYYTTGETNAAITAATDALAQAIAEQGYQTSGDVQNAISGKANSDDVYTKQETEDKIDEKIAEASGVTTGQVQTMIDESISGKTDKSDAIKNLYFNAYSSGQTSGNNGQLDFKIKKANNTTGSSPDAVAAKDGLYIQRNSYNGADIYVDFNTVAAKSDIPAVTGYADAVRYDPQSQEMKFYHGGIGGTEVFSFDASPFLIDGMIESVAITSITSGGSEVEVLQITWNSAAGGQVTNIPLTDIFNPDNYYTKDEVDAELSAKTDNSAFTAFTASTDTALGNKADTTAMTEAISEATSGKVDNSTYTAYTAATDAAIAGKANTADVVTNVSIYTEYDSDNGPKLKYAKNGSDVYEGFLYQTGNGLYYDKNSRKISVNTNTIQKKLTSGTNIKTVGGESLLGSGNIAFPAGLQVQVSGSTLVFG